MVQDLANEDGEFAAFLAEGKELAEEIKEHDPVLAFRFLTIVHSFDMIKNHIEMHYSR